MLIRWVYPSGLSFVGLLPLQRPALVPAKHDELQGKRTNQPTNVGKAAKRGVSVGGIYSQAGEIVNFHNIEAGNLEEAGIFFRALPSTNKQR